MTDRIRHHLDDAMLMGYATGALPEAFSVVVASHVSLCPDCRARLMTFEELGGASLEAETGAPVAETSLADTLTRIRADSREEAPRPVRRGVLPTPISDYVGNDPESLRWRPLGGGVRQIVLDTAGPGTVRLFHIPGGVAVPDHDHGGIELTMVIAGAYRDEVDRFGPGDVERADGGFEHRPVAEPGAPCICIAATDARLRFSGFLPRIVGQILGI